MFKRRSDLKIFKCVVFYVHKTPEIKYWKIRCEFSFFSVLFLTTKQWVQSKFRESKLKHFFYYSKSYYYRVHQLWFRSGCFNAHATYHRSKRRFFFFLSAGERRRKRRKLECSLERRADLEQLNFVSGLFYISVSSDLLQCALTSLNERCMSFASCCLSLGCEKVTCGRI